MYLTSTQAKSSFLISVSYTLLWCALYWLVLQRLFDYIFSPAGFILPLSYIKVITYPLICQIELRFKNGMTFDLKY